MPPKGVVGQRVELPAALHQFTGLKVGGGKRQAEPFWC